MALAVGTDSGDGVETSFPLPFEYLEDDDVRVEVYAGGAWVTKTIDTHYSIDGDDNVVFVASELPASATNNIRFTRITDATQTWSEPNAIPGSPAAFDEMRDAAIIGARGLFVAQENRDTADKLSSTSASEGASLIGVQDSAGNFSATNVETVLAELHHTHATPDHGSLSGLGDDDHTIYSKADGSRAITGNQTFNDNVMIKLGSGGDSTVKYDGTNTILDPKAVGSGYLRINGKVGLNVAPVEEIHAADTVRADTKFNHNGTDGLTGTIEFYDAMGGTQTVTINGGIITAWTS
jgi:hypothetical protein